MNAGYVEELREQSLKSEPVSMLTSPKGSSGNTVSLNTENFEPETYTASLYNATSGGFSLQG